MSTRLVIVHDVLGTLFGLEAPIDELQSLFGEQVSDRMFAELIVMVCIHGAGVRLPCFAMLTDCLPARLHVQDWYHAAQRDFTTLSINGAYRPIAAVFKATLPRILLQAGLCRPTGSTQRRSKAAGDGLTEGSTFSQAESAGEGSPFGKEVTERMMASLGRLTPRPGMVQAFTHTYRDAKRVPQHVRRVDLWGATNGSLILTQKLFGGALGERVPLYTGQHATAQHAEQHRPNTNGVGVALFSCDEIQVAKPDPRVYLEVKRRIQADSAGEETRFWFVASHTWDLFSAKLAGFKTAWVPYEEFDMCKDLYGTPDVVASNLDELAQKVLQHEAEHASPRT